MGAREAQISSINGGPRTPPPPSIVASKHSCPFAAPLSHEFGPALGLQSRPSCRFLPTGPTPATSSSREPLSPSGCCVHSTEHGARLARGLRVSRCCCVCAGAPVTLEGGASVHTCSRSVPNVVGCGPHPRVSPPHLAPAAPLLTTTPNAFRRCQLPPGAQPTLG